MNQNKISESFLFAGIVSLLIAIIALLFYIRGVLISIVGAIMGILSWIVSGVFSLPLEVQILIYAIIGCSICYVGFKLSDNSNNRRRIGRY